MKKHVTKKFFAFFIAVLLIMSTFSISFTSFAAESIERSTGNDNWVSAWSTSPVDVSLSELGNGIGMLGVIVSGITSRVSIEPTMTGNKIRIVYSNEYGTTVLRIEKSTVAQTDANNTKAIDSSTLTDITFNGEQNVSIPAGEKITSDPIAFDVVAGKRITINTYCRNLNVMKTVGLIGGDSYLSLGNATSKEKIKALKLAVTADSGAYEVIPMLTEIDVAAAPDASVCVIFGDSTVDNEVPRYLSATLRENGINNVSVTQAALKGNRLLYDGVGIFSKFLGDAGVERFEKDVLTQAGVKSVIIKIGVNDLIHPYCRTKKGKAPIVTNEEMIEGYKEIINMCHERGITVYICEIAAWKGYTRGIFIPWGDINWTAELDQPRHELNDWIKSADCPADGYIVTDKLNDPNDSDALFSTYTTDGIHYTDEGTNVLSNIFYSNIFNAQ